MTQAPPPSPRQPGSHLPILLLLAALLAVGLLTFRDYGLTWDEPLFYDYGKASQYAYSISARLDGTFDLEKSFGASAGDHVTRGPAYLLVGGLVEGLLENAGGLDLASAWHLTNFLTYLAGLTFFYLLARFWLDPWPAGVSTAFFATQPVLWNHAFINPKDSPFAIFFLVSIYLGFKMVDQWNGTAKQVILSSILPGIVLGITCAIRFIGPYAALLVFLYFLSKPNRKFWWGFVPYGILAFVSMVALWPFLWPDPIGQFIFTLNAMSDTSANLKILFMGNEYHAYDLPRRYFPVLLTITLTEPTWPLFLFGLITAMYKSFRQKVGRTKLTTVFLWFGIVIAALVGLNPPNSDGYRHYLFMLPPVFIFAGFGIQGIVRRVRFKWAQVALVALILFPAIFNNVTLHPYQYAYYNTFALGTKNAFRKYETDYWLTCYKEAIENFNDIAPQNARIFIKREPYIAAYYTRPDISVYDFRTDFKSAQPGDYLLVNTRTNEDSKTLRGAPVILEVGRQGALFCVIKQIQ